jgi:catechol 2,3-dioxygenase-like lactoylglutathione lyase family enzyme
MAIAGSRDVRADDRDARSETRTVRGSEEGLILDHVTFRTTDLEGTRAFLEELLDLKPGYRPPFNFPGYWLYFDGAPVIHLVPAKTGESDRDGEGIDHVGLRLSDHDGTCRKLEQLGQSYSKMDLPDLGERRLFVTTPTGILLELVFRTASA